MVKVCVKIFFRIYVFQDWTPFCGQLRDSGSRETFSSTTLVLIFSSTALVLIFWLLWVHKDSLNPIYFCLGEVGHPVAQYCSISPLKQDAKSAPEVGGASPSSCPVCLASAIPSLFTSLSAHGCQPPKDSAIKGRKAIPCCRQSSSAGTRLPEGNNYLEPSQCQQLRWHVLKILFYYLMRNSRNQISPIGATFGTRLPEGNNYLEPSQCQQLDSMFLRFYYMTD